MRYERLYIDVDGVVNAMRHGIYRVCIIHEPDDPATHVKIRMDGGVVKEFFDKFDEVVWATTWILYPNLLAGLEYVLGVGPFDRVPLTRDQLTGISLTSSGKHLAVSRHYDANPRPSLWIDDDIGPLDIKVAKERGIFTVAPDPMVGAYNFMKAYRG